MAGAHNRPFILYPPQDASLCKALQIPPRKEVFGFTGANWRAYNFRYAVLY